MAVKSKIEEFREDLRKHMATLIVSAFGFVAALSWNNAIQTFLALVIPAGREVFYNFANAIIVTIIAAIAILIVSHLKPKK